MEMLLADMMVHPIYAALQIRKNPSILFAVMRSRSSYRTTIGLRFSAATGVRCVCAQAGWQCAIPRCRAPAIECNLSSPAFAENYDPAAHNGCMSTLRRSNIVRDVIGPSPGRPPTPTRKCPLGGCISASSGEIRNIESNTYRI